MDGRSKGEPVSPVRNELEDVLRVGIREAQDMSLPHLERRGKLLSRGKKDSSSYVEYAIRDAIDVLGDTPYARSAQDLFGLTDGSRDKKIGVRQELAAGQIPISPRQFRRPGSYQERVVVKVEEAILGARVVLEPNRLDTRRLEQQIRVRPAVESDREFVVRSMNEALEPYYGGDHEAHAERIFTTHIEGGEDRLGFFSTEQHMMVATLGDSADSPLLGMIHVVGKRQGTYKISPLIVSPNVRGRLHVGSTLLDHAVDYAVAKGARQIYCTVAEDNRQALQFFVRSGFVIAGRSASPYRQDMTELMLYKLLTQADPQDAFDRPNISVLPMQDHHKEEVRQLLLKELPKKFTGIDDEWVDALFDGYSRRFERNINEKYKLIYVAVDRSDFVLGVAGATPKKGEPIKLMPLIATTGPAFTALIADIPYQLKDFGRKVYAHLSAGPDETIALQKFGWRLDAALPAAYHQNYVTHQWSVDIDAEDFMRTMRVKQQFLNYIKAGTKPLEVRVGYDSIKSIEVGERIRLASRDDSQVVLIKDVRKYDNFDAMSEIEDLSLVVPGRTETEVLRTLKDIYPQDRESLGVFVFELEPDGSVNVP